MKRDKRVTIKDMYAFYPYRKNPPKTGTTISQPYVAKKDESDHEYVLTYIEWRVIVNDYIELVKEYLLKGKSFYAPYYLGEFQLRRYNLTRKINWEETRKLGYKKYFNDIDQCSVLLKWYRTFSNSRFTFKNHWKIKLANVFKRQIHKAIQDDVYYTYSITPV